VRPTPPILWTIRQCCLIERCTLHAAIVYTYAAQNTACPSHNEQINIYCGRVVNSLIRFINLFDSNHKGGSYVVLYETQTDIKQTNTDTQMYRTRRKL